MNRGFTVKHLRHAPSNWHKRGHRILALMLIGLITTSQALSQTTPDGPKTNPILPASVAAKMVKVVTLVNSLHSNTAITLTESPMDSGMYVLMGTVGGVTIPPIPLESFDDAQSAKYGISG